MLSSFFQKNPAFVLVDTQPIKQQGLIVSYINALRLVILLFYSISALVAPRATDN